MARSLTFRPDDTVRVLGTSVSLLMSVRAASKSVVLCACFGPDGKVQYARFAPSDLELVHREDSGLDADPPTDFAHSEFSETELAEEPSVGAAKSVKAPPIR